MWFDKREEKGEKEKRRKGEMEKRRKGEKEKRRKGEKEKGEKYYLLQLLQLNTGERAVLIQAYLAHLHWRLKFTAQEKTRA